LDLVFQWEVKDVVVASPAETQAGGDPFRESYRTDGFRLFIAFKTESTMQPRVRFI